MSLRLLVLAKPGTPWLQDLDRLKASTEITITDDEAMVREVAPRTDVILNAAFTPKLLNIALPLAGKLQWTHSLWTGVDKLLTPEVVASPAPLTNGRGAFKRSLAEWTVGAMLFFSYKMRRMIQQQEAGIWQDFTTEELHGRALGIVGYGEIGRAAAERARAFGMEILALRRRPELFGDDPLMSQTFSIPEINDLMAASDYVLVAAPLTDETRGMVGSAQIAAMKPTGVIINVGRGAVIDEVALAAALEQKKIRGAALDVFSVEPLPSDHIFYKLDNVLFSPHTADRLSDFATPAFECFFDNLRRLQAGEPLQYVVDKQQGY